VQSLDNLKGMVLPPERRFECSRVYSHYLRLKLLCLNQPWQQKWMNGMSIDLDSRPIETHRKLLGCGGPTSFGLEYILTCFFDRSNIITVSPTLSGSKLINCM